MMYRATDFWVLNGLSFASAKKSVEGFRFECLWSLPQNQNTENVRGAINRLIRFMQIGRLEKLREGSIPVAHAITMPYPINQNPLPE